MTNSPSINRVPDTEELPEAILNANANTRATTTESDLVDGSIRTDIVHGNAKNGSNSSPQNEMKTMISVPLLSNDELLDVSLWKFEDMADDNRCSKSDNIDTDETTTEPHFTRTTSAVAATAVGSTKTATENSIRYSIDIIVDIIIPVHNASTTIRETIHSAMNQIWYISNVPSSPIPNILIHVCCYNDASTDDSWTILQELHNTYTNNSTDSNITLKQENHVADKSSSNGYYQKIPTQLLISSSLPNTSPRGPGYARNRAVQMTVEQLSGTNNTKNSSMKYQHFVCWLDSDDIIHPARIYYQIHTMMCLLPSVRLQTLIGCHFERFIHNIGDVNNTFKNNKESNNMDNTHTDNDARMMATPHYTQWANDIILDPSCTNRMNYERFREVTIIQPTWMMLRYRYVHILHGYLECPINAITTTNAASNGDDKDTAAFKEWVQNVLSVQESDGSSSSWRLMHPLQETLQSIRIAEDMRMFYEHFHYNGRLQGTATNLPLVYYRYRPTISQSALTSRKLLLALRVTAFEHLVLNSQYWNDKFIVWGAGRDGKDFIKALSNHARNRIYCILDVDDIKIARGSYHYCGSNHRSSIGKQCKEDSFTIPIIHFSLAIKDSTKRLIMYQAWKSGSCNENATGKKNESYDAPVHAYYGRVVKNTDLHMKNDLLSTHLPTSPSKRMKLQYDGTKEKIDPGTKKLDLLLIPNLPIVVCVTMYRTNGALESNVTLVQRTEGKDLWYFI